MAAPVLSPPRTSVCYAAGLDILEVDMRTLLVHVTRGPDDPTRVRLTFECDRVLSY